MQPLNRQRYLSLRQRYEPDKVRLIVLTESPPVSGKYFYDVSGEISEPLFKALMEHLGLFSLSKEAGLHEFQRQGCALVDSTYEPVNGLRKAQRDAVILRDFDDLCRDLVRLSPDRSAPIVLLKANVCRLLEHRLEARQFHVLNGGRVVYFPSHGRQPSFRRQFKETLERANFARLPAERPIRSDAHLTMQEDIALGLIFERAGEPRYNRTIEEYQAIAKTLPPIKVLHGYVVDRLKEIAESGSAPRLCYFQAGDQKARFLEYPDSVTIEVVRGALVKSGMREKQARKPRRR